MVINADSGPVPDGGPSLVRLTWQSSGHALPEFRGTSRHGLPCI